MGIATVAVGLNTFYGGVLFGVLLKLKLSHNMHLLRSLQKCQGSGIAEWPLRRVDVSFEVWARTAAVESHGAAGLADAGQRCKMSFLLERIFNHAGLTML